MYACTCKLRLHELVVCMLVCMYVYVRMFACMHASMYVCISIWNMCVCIHIQGLGSAAGVLMGIDEFTSQGLHPPRCKPGVHGALVNQMHFHPVVA